MTDPALPSTLATLRGKRIAVTGATGFLGSALVRHIERAGGTVHRLVRGAPSRQNDIRWDPASGTIDLAALEGLDAAVHLAGEPIGHRWTAERKRRIRESRIIGTSLLARTIQRLQRPPTTLLSGSAMGVYGDRGDTLLDETTAPGDDFLARVAVEWELAAMPVRSVGVRLVSLRTGLVLHRDGGALARMLLPFRLGLGGRLGSGRQWVSWIALADWLGAVQHALIDTGLAGPVNLVAPAPVTNAEFTRTLGFVLHRPTPFPVPPLALRAVYGEMAQATLFASQRAVPTALLGAGFQFRYPMLEPALEEAVRGESSV